MTEFLTDLKSYWPDLSLRNGVSALLILLGGWLLAKLLRRRLTLGRLSPTRRHLIQRIAWYGVWSVTLALALDTVGLQLGVVLGAAGVFTVAVGFAARTSLSNLISGVFLMVEEPFQVGDTIEVAGISGTILSVELLSMRIRTADNRLVRIPSEMVFNGVLQNLDAFEVRQVTLDLGVRYGTDLATLEECLLSAAAENPLILKEPPPTLTALGFGEGSVDVRLGVWCQTKDQRAARLTLLGGIATALIEAKLEPPFAARSVAPWLVRPPSTTGSLVGSGRP